MNKTKIEWCDSTWNPVTGCLHKCEYCYARRIAERFGTLYKGPQPEDEGLTFLPDEPERFYELDEPVRDNSGRVEPYPANFYPTLHRYKLGEPQGIKTQRNIFVCSMADLFGGWVPDEWIEQVFEACGKAPQHRYMFLTKNPQRYIDLEKAGRLPKRDNMWYGSTITDGDTPYFFFDKVNTFVSIEPILGHFAPHHKLMADWAIMGAMTGPGSKGKRPSQQEIDNILRSVGAAGVPVFMKDSLVPIVGEESMRREFPWPTHVQKGAGQDAGASAGQSAIMPAT